MSSTTTSTLQRVMHSRLGRSSSHLSLNTSIEDEKRAGLCRERSADVCTPRKCKWPKVHTTQFPMKYEVEGKRNAVAFWLKSLSSCWCSAESFSIAETALRLKRSGPTMKEARMQFRASEGWKARNQRRLHSAAHLSTNCCGRFSSFTVFGNSYDGSHSCHERHVFKPLQGHVAHGFQPCGASFVPSCIMLEVPMSALSVSRPRFGAFWVLWRTQGLNPSVLCLVKDCLHATR